MQAYRQAHHRVAQRHARAAAKGNYSAVKVVVGSILGFVLIVVLFTVMLGAGASNDATPSTGTVQSQDSIDRLANSLRADSQLRRIDASIE